MKYSSLTCKMRAMRDFPRVDAESRACVARGGAFDGDARTAPASGYSSSVSSTMVKGPSFTSSTFMSAANVPVATRGTSFLARLTKYS